MPVRAPPGPCTKPASDRRPALAARRTAVRARSAAVAVPRTFTNRSRSPRHGARSADTGPSPPHRPRWDPPTPTEAASGPGSGPSAGSPESGVQRDHAPPAWRARSAIRAGSGPCRARSGPTRLKRLGARNGRDTSAFPRAAAFPAGAPAGGFIEKSTGSGRNGRRESAGRRDPEQGQDADQRAGEERPLHHASEHGARAPVALWEKRCPRILQRSPICNRDLEPKPASIGPSVAPPVGADRAGKPRGLVVCALAVHPFAPSATASTDLARHVNPFNGTAEGAPGLRDRRRGRQHVSRPHAAVRDDPVGSGHGTRASANRGGGYAYADTEDPRLQHEAPVGRGLHEPRRRAGAADDGVRSLRTPGPERIGRLRAGAAAVIRACTRGSAR